MLGGGSEGPGSAEQWAHSWGGAQAVWVGQYERPFFDGQVQGRSRKSNIPLKAISPLRMWRRGKKLQL